MLTYPQIGLMKQRFGQFRWVQVLKRNPFSVRRRSPLDNIYHCCVQKTGSQWIRALFSDPRVFQYSGLTPYSYQLFQPGGSDPRLLCERKIETAFPRKTIGVGIYIDYPSYAAIPKPAEFRTVFIMRDPRDIVVSAYFSQRYSHQVMGTLDERRKKLNEVSESEGIRMIVEKMRRSTLFQALGSWVGSDRQDERVRLVKYEDLIGPDKMEHFRILFQHCCIELPDGILGSLMDDYSFEKMSGRKPGQEDRQSHLRKGAAGDWRNHFDDAVAEEFYRITGNLVKDLGYDD